MTWPKSLYSEWWTHFGQWIPPIIDGAGWSDAVRHRLEDSRDALKLIPHGMMDGESLWDCLFPMQQAIAALFIGFSDLRWLEWLPKSILDGPPKEEIYGRFRDALIEKDARVDRIRSILDIPEAMQAIDVIDEFLKHAEERPDEFITLAGRIFASESLSGV